MQGGTGSAFRRSRAGDGRGVIVVVVVVVAVVFAGVIVTASL